MEAPNPGALLTFGVLPLWYAVHIVLSPFK
jgi:hypothetical protein